MAKLTGIGERKHVPFFDSLLPSYSCDCPAHVGKNERWSSLETTARHSRGWKRVGVEPCVWCCPTCYVKPGARREMLRVLAVKALTDEGG